MNPWTDYWNSGNLNSCVSVSSGDSVQLMDFWRRLAQKMIAESRVLDLACGNGAVSRSMLKENKLLYVTGVDQASIKISKPPLKNEDSARFQLLGNAPLESLPFKNSSFDCIVSQFGVEYSDFNRSLKEVARVARPGARLHFLLHHQDSLILDFNQKKIPEIDVLLGSDGLLTYVQKFIEHATTFSELELRGRAYIEMGHAKSEQISGQVFRGVNLIESLLEASPSRAQALLVNMVKKMRSERERLQQMHSSALSEQGVADLASALVAEGASTIGYDHFFIGQENSKALVAWRMLGEF